MMLTVLSTLNPANIMLQSDSCDLVDGIALVESGTQQLSDKRKDDSDPFKIKMIWEKSGLNADSVNNSGVSDDNEPSTESAPSLNVGYM